MTSHTVADLVLELTWEDHQVRHTEHYFCHRVDFWRDLFPDSLLFKPLRSPESTHVALELSPDREIPRQDPKKIRSLSWNQLRDTAPRLDLGRFYPQGMLMGLPGIFQETLLPFRCVGLNANGFMADLNPPLAGLAPRLDIHIHDPVTSPPDSQRGGRVRDWVGRLMDGPGMQRRYQGRPSSFFNTDAFTREDMAPDEDFYAIDRFVHHMDARARQDLTRLYQDLLSPGDRVLDLMAGWHSHLPDIPLSQVHGIGLNKNELKANTALTDFHVQNLNTRTALPFADRNFDLALCSLSVEYLVNPVALFKETARVLKPGGIFALAVSNRWFPEKTIALWPHLHEFERMGLILEYFHASQRFDTLSTHSRRGYPRPETDSYFPDLQYSDPLYLVTGRTKE